MRGRALAAATLVCLLAFTGCSPSKKAVARRDTTPRGGTFHVAAPSEFSPLNQVNAEALDPQTNYTPDAWEIFA